MSFSAAVICERKSESTAMSVDRVVVKARFRTSGLKARVGKVKREMRRVLEDMLGSWLGV
jgi:hypothetical protein